LKLQHRVADIVRQVRFAPNCSKPALWKALLHYQDKGGNIDKGAPDDFLSAAQRTALTGPDGKFRVSLGEFAQTDKNSHRIFVRSWFYVGFSQIVAFQI
jgi:hypothetical protein